jgi:hypothetical protein
MNRVPSNMNIDISEASVVGSQNYPKIQKIKG